MSEHPEAPSIFQADPGRATRDRGLRMGLPAWALPLLVLLPLVLLSAVVYTITATDHRSAMEERLQTLASVRQDWLQTHLSSVEAWTALQARSLSDVASGAVAAPGDPAALARLSRALADAVAGDSVLLGATLADSAGGPVASAGLAAPSPLPRPPERTALVRLQPTSPPTGLVEVWSAPVGSGEAPATLWLLYSGAELLRIGSTSAGLGTTGETLLGVKEASGELRFITPVRFRDSGPLAPVESSGTRLPLEEAIEGREGFLDDLRDYRDEPVVAAVRQVEPTGWGLVVKMDRSEAMVPLLALRNTLLLGTAGIGALVLAIAVLVTRRIRRDEQTLAASNVRLTRALRLSPFPAMLHAEDGEVLLVSRSWAERTGYGEADLATLADWTRLAYGERAPDVQAIIDTLYEDQPDPVDDGVFRIRARDGEELVWSFSSMALGPLPDGRRTVLSMAVDVTERTRLVETLRTSMSRLDAMLRALPLPVWHVSADGMVVLCNAAAEETFGWTLDEVRGRKLPVIPPDREEEFRDHLQRVREGPLVGVRTVRRRKDGTTFPVLLHAAQVKGTDGESRGVVGIYEDLTEAEAREAELRRLNRALSFVTASNTSLVRSESRAELLDTVCQVATEVGGYAHTWIAVRHADGGELHLVQETRNGDRVPLLELADLREEIETAGAAGVAFVSHGLSERDHAWERTLADEGYRAIAVLPFPADSGVGGFIAFARREADGLDEQEVAILQELAADLAYGLWVERIEEDLFLVREAVSQLDVGISFLDGTNPTRPLVYVNPGFTTTTGYGPEEALGRSLSLLHGPESDPEDVAEIERALAEGRGTQLTILSYRRSGEPFWNRLTVEPLHDEAGSLTHFVAFQEDVTEQRRVGQELEHRARLSAVGALAGGVAHDFRNILTASQGLLELSLKDATLDEEARENLAELERLVARGTAVTQRLLALSRRAEQEPRALPLRSLLEESALLVSHTLRDDIVFRTSLVDAPVAVRVDPEAFTTVLLNLVRNAEQAMPSGGELSLETLFPVTPGAPPWWPVDLDPDGGEPWVRISLRDSGIGMDQETLAHAFDPYFTTKPAGEGTGLGLPAVYGAVEGMGGRVWLESSPGEGTTVHLLLPTLESWEEEPEGTADRGTRGDARPGVILLAEDDRSVLRVFTKALERAGHTVLAGEDGALALAALQAHRGRVDLVVTDGVMPNMSGAELAMAVWADDPQVPVVVTSGFGSEDLRDEFPEETPGKLVFKPKPLSLEELVETVQDLMPPAEDDTP